MYKIVFSILVPLIVCASYTCNKSSSGKLKGKLVIKELCSHYVVQVVQGKVDTSMVVNNWKDEKRGTFNNVFTISNRCDFPGSLNEGDEFEFSFDPNPLAQNCAVCMAFYPTPAKSNAIKIHQSK